MVNARVLITCWCVVSLPSCATVKPYERGALAKPCMNLQRSAAIARYRSKVVESTTAGGLPGEAPGGGCGCTH